MDERVYYLAFSAFPGVGPMRFALLCGHFGSAKKAWEASRGDLVKIGLGEALTAKFDSFRREFSVGGYAKEVKDKEIAALILTDEKYPTLLREIPDPPFVLYVKGKRIRGSTPKGVEPPNGNNWDISKSIAVVGTRKITSYGREVTRLLTQQLVSAGVTIVSGLAYGVDGAAHEAAIGEAGKRLPYSAVA